MANRLLHTEGFRLSAIYAGIFAASMLVLGGFVLLITNQAFRDQIIQFSQDDVAAIRHGYEQKGLKEAVEIAEQLTAGPTKADFLLLQKDGSRLAGNLPAMAPVTGLLELPEVRGVHRDLLGEGALLAPGLYVFSGSDLTRAHAMHEHILHVLLWLFAAVLALGALGGVVVSRSFLARADAIARACRTIMDGNLKARIPVRGTQDELDRLSGTINEMVDRIVALMENLRQVTNDVAHDLRTPVTHLRQRLERARSDSATPEDYAQALDAAIGSADDILALFSALLRIAQIEGGARRTAFAALDLRDVLQPLCDVFAPVAEDREHRLAATLPAGMRVRGDKELLVQLFSNLIENAILHTPAGTQIQIRMERSAAQIRVIVSDNGPGVPAEEHERLFQRFYRREASRTRPGYGLGLSLAAAIAELHGAGIAIVPEGAVGLAVQVTFTREV